MQPFGIGYSLPKDWLFTKSQYINVFIYYNDLLTFIKYVLVI